MHFKLDEQIPVRLKKHIEKLGHKSSTVFEESLSGKDDKKIIEVCKKEGLILITLDNDFSNIISFPIETHNGIILIRTKKQGSDSVIGLFNKLVETIDIKSSERAILIYDGNKVRVRR